VPTPDEIRSLIDRYAATVTSRDVDAVVGLFTEDAVQRDPANQPPKVGRGAIREFFQSAVDASESTLFEALAVHTCGNEAAIDLRVTVTVGGGTMVISGIEVFTFTDEGLISALSAYWDDADITFDAG
jgi:steroid delta-isomerase